MDIFKKINDHFKNFSFSGMTLKIHHKGEDFTIRLEDHISGRKIFLMVYVNGVFSGKWKKGVDIEADFYKCLEGKHYTSDIPEPFYNSPKTWVSYLKNNFKASQIEIVQS